jgi:hypothetical protein
MDKITAFFLLSAIITIGTPLCFLLKWLYYKHIEKHPLKFSIDSSSVSAGGEKNANPHGITSISTSLKLIIHNRSSLKKQFIIDNLTLTTRKKIEEFQINIAPSLNNSNYVNLNNLYHIDPKGTIILHIRITITPPEVCNLNKLKENIRNHSSEKQAIRIQFKVPPNNKKHSRPLKFSGFFKELTGLIKSFE